MSADPCTEHAMHPAASAMLCAPDSVSMEDSHLDTMPAFQTGIHSTGGLAENVPVDSSMLSDDNPFRLLQFYPKSAWKRIFDLVVADLWNNMNGDDEQQEGAPTTAVSIPVDQAKGPGTKSFSKAEQASSNRLSTSLYRKPKVVQNNDSDSDGAPPSRASASSAYSALARRGFKKVQKALLKRRGATSFTNLVSLMKRDRVTQPDLLTPEDAPFVEQCPEPDYLEGMLVAPESPTTRPYKESVSSGSESGEGRSNPGGTGTTRDSRQEIMDEGGQQGGTELTHSPRAPSVRFEDAGDGSSMNSEGVHGTQPLGEGRTLRPRTPAHPPGGREDTASQGGGTHGDAALIRQHMRHIAEIMEGVGTQRHVGDGALRELLAVASARILLLTAPMDPHSRALVLEALRRSERGSGSPRAAWSPGGAPALQSEPHAPASWRCVPGRATAASAAGGDGLGGDLWPGPWPHAGVHGGTAPAAMQARGASGISTGDLPVLALTAPAGLWDETTALDRPPFRLLTPGAAPLVGTQRRSGAWSARARRIQSHACTADLDGLDEDLVDTVGHEERQAMEQMVAASHMLALAESFGVEEGGPLATDLVEALSSMEAIVSAEAPAAVSEQSSAEGAQVQAAERGPPGWRRDASTAPGAVQTRLSQEEVLSLIQQSRLWRPGWNEDVYAVRAHSMPNADTPAWRMSPRRSDRPDTVAEAEPEAPAISAPLCNAHACMGAGDIGGYKGVVDVDRDELVLFPSGSDQPSGASALCVESGKDLCATEDAGAGNVQADGYHSHAYTGTLDPIKDEFILDDDELESNA